LITLQNFFEQRQHRHSSSISVAVWQAYFAACAHWWPLRQKRHAEFFAGKEKERSMDKQDYNLVNSALL
jgi:hypothetical protein